MTNPSPGRTSNTNNDLKPKKKIPIPVERVLKLFLRFLTLVKEDIACGLLGSSSSNTALDGTRRTKMVEQMQQVVRILTKYMNLTLDQNAKEQELMKGRQPPWSSIHRNRLSRLPAFIIIIKESNVGIVKSQIQ